MKHEVEGGGGPLLRMPAGGSARPASRETVDERLHFVKQDGGPVFKYASRQMADAPRRLLERNGYTPEDIGLLLPHQANVRIIEAAQSRLRLPSRSPWARLSTRGASRAATWW